MGKGRLEAFSDAVIAILLTIMVLEMKVPHGENLAALKPMIPVFVSYILSFIYLGIYWNNHHHMLHATRKISGSILWPNLYLLFWLSIVPFVTGWVGENHFSPVPMAAYGFVLLMSAFAWWILQRVIVRSEGPDSLVARIYSRDIKGNLSPFLYFAGIVTAFWSPFVSGAFYISVALMWLIPDRRVEKELEKADAES